MTFGKLSQITCKIVGVFAHTYKFKIMLALSWDILYTY